jgi:putative transposase
MAKTSDAKKEQIKATRNATRERRKTQTCKCYTLKIVQNRLNKTQKQYLHKVFIEAKWFYNFLLSQENIFDCLELTKLKEVQIKILNGFEKRKIEFLSSQTRRSLFDRLCNSIKGLSVLKSKDFTVGRLKFKPEINSIDFIQHKISWQIKANKIKLQGLKEPLSVRGLEQIKGDFELANCKLVRRASGYYLQITTYQEVQEREKTSKVVGLDFGIKDNITTSNNEKYNFKFPESEKLKRLQTHFARKKKGSKNRYKLLSQIKKEYEKTSNAKKDACNKFTNKLQSENDLIIIQDELISLWHKGIFGKQVQHSILGAIKSKLKTFESTLVLSSKEPTTKMCFCGFKNDIQLKDRVFKCQKCKLEMERDLKSSLYILHRGLQQKAISCGVQDYTCGEMYKSLIIAI